MKHHKADHLGYTLGDKGLLVKVDGNAQNIIEQWKKRSGIKQDSDGMDVLSTQVKIMCITSIIQMFYR